MAGGRIAGITVEIGGDTTKLSKALSNVNKSLKTTQSGLKDVDKLLKLNPGNVELLTQKQGYLTKAISDTEKKLQTEKEALAQLKANSTTDEVTEEQMALEREIIATEGDLKSLKEEYKNFGSVASQQIQLAGEKIQNVGKAVTNVGVGITKGVTVPIVAVGAASVAAWKEVDSAMDVIVKKTGASGKPLEEMKKAAENIATTIPTSFENAATAVGEVNTRFGLMGDDLEDLSTKFVKFAELNDKDVTSSVDSVQKAMAAMGVDTKDAGLMLDALNTAAQQSGIDVDTLTSSIVSNAAAFDGMGLSTGDVISLLANVEKSGVDTSTVMTGLQKAMQNATKQGKPASTALAEVEAAIKGAGTETDATRIAMNLFGKKAGPAIAKAVREGQISFEAMGTSLQDYAGNVESTFEGTLDPLDQVNTIMNTLKATGASIVEAAAPALTTAIETVGNVVKGLAEKWNSLDKGTQQMIIKFALAAAAVGPLVTGLGGAITGAGKVVSAFGKVKGAIGAAGAAGGLVGRIGGLVTAAGPILAGGAVVAGIVAGGVLIYKNWDKIKAGAKILGDKIKTAWGNIKTNVTAAAKKIGEDVKAKFDVLKTNAVKIFGDLGTNLKSKLNAAKTALVTVAGNIGTNIKTKFEELKSAAPVVFENMATSLKSKLNAAKTALETVAGNIGSAIKTKFEALKSAAPEVFEGMATSLKSKLNAAKTALETVAGNIGTGIKTAFDTLKTNAETVFGNMGTGLESKLNAAKTSLETVAGNIGTAIKTKFEELKTNAETLFADLGTSINTKFTEIKDNVTTTITNLASDAKKKFDEITTNAVNAAKQLGTDVANAFNTAKDGIATAAGNIATGAKEKFDGMKKTVGGVVSSLGTKIKTTWGDIRDNVDKKINGLTSNASTRFESADKAVSGSVGNISKTVSDNLGPSAEMATSCFVTVGKAAKTDAGGGIKYAGEKVDGLQKKLNKSSSTHFNSQMSSAGSAAKNDLGAGANEAKSDVGGMQSTLNKMSLYTFGKTVDTAASKAGTLATKMSSSESSASSLKSTLANMKLKMPSFSLPKFSLDWGTTTIFGKTWSYPKGINVSWHRDAYDNPLMFTSPTVLQTPHGLHGFGDGPGGEIVLSDKKLREIAGGGATYNINVYGANGQNVNDLAYAIQRRLVALERQREAAGMA